MRIPARTSAGIGAFHGNPRLVLCSLNARAVTCRKVVASNVGNARPNAPHPFAAASGSSERGWRPCPNSNFICSSVTTSPSARSSPASPVPSHRPGDSPLSS